MNDLKYFKTIEDCEKAIVNKSIEIDISYFGIESLFNCFTRLVRTIYIWAFIITCVYTIFTKGGGIVGFKEIFIELIVYLVCALLINWVKFNLNREYEIAKKQLIDNLIYSCKEFEEYDKNSWEAKQMYKRMMNLSGIDIYFDNNQE